MRSDARPVKPVASVRHLRPARPRQCVNVMKMQVSRTCGPRTRRQCLSGLGKAARDLMIDLVEPREQYCVGALRVRDKHVAHHHICNRIRACDAHDFVQKPCKARAEGLNSCGAALGREDKVPDADSKNQRETPLMTVGAHRLPQLHRDVRKIRGEAIHSCAICVEPAHEYSLYGRKVVLGPIKDALLRGTLLHAPRWLVAPVVKPTHELEHQHLRLRVADEEHVNGTSRPAQARSKGTVVRLVPFCMQHRKRCCIVRAEHILRVLAAVTLFTPLACHVWQTCAAVGERRVGVARQRGVRTPIH
mmetsp:Transcript_14678/g.46020  ORF Transcript_14678/g.46020 Transcript_14678/m.46020 type:complete len:304 (-) Transcript_14678:18-929(-)